MTDRDTTIGSLRDRVGMFAREREWEQFHNPKDLAAAIAIEASELLEVFLWQTPEQAMRAVEDQDMKTRVVEELADVVIYCLSFANSVGFDITTAVAGKVEINRAKYPAEVVRGSPAKYTDYPPEGRAAADESPVPPS